ncbi:MAG: right-handed parallel beta-helix repeat-containing protein, partial [Nitrospirae bacterium]|nr:right-handed parallel beta-helix repeat-containing protein [Nitrospirota bacterium]
MIKGRVTITLAIFVLTFMLHCGLVHADEPCPSTLSDDLTISIPALKVGSTVYSADLSYSPSGPSSEQATWFRVSRVEASGLFSCSGAASLIVESDRIILRVPVVTYGDYRFLADFEYVSSIDGQIWLKVSNLGIIFFVAKNGSDSNAGTESEPWLTIQKAADTVVAGNAVYIRTGTYHERVIPQNSGSSGSQIVYAAYPGDTVTIDGTGISVPEDEGLFYIHGKSRITVSGLRVVNSAQAGIYADAFSGNIAIQGNYTNNTGSSGIGIWNSSNIIIDGNEVESSCSNGWQENITVAGTSFFEVRNNHVHNELTGYGKEGICIKDGSANGKVYGNHVHHTWKVGIYIDAWDKHTHDIDVFQNIVNDSRNDGFTVASEMGGLLENIKFFNNIAYNNSFLGINISLNGDVSVQSHPMRNIEVINNTFYNNGLSGWGGGMAVGNPDVQGIIFRNNICSQNLSF